MKFDLITENERLWAVRYEDCLDNVLDSILGQWNDVAWLRSFFKQNIEDLASYFKITDVNETIYDTIEDSERLLCHQARTGYLHHHRRCHQTDPYHAGA